ncbi:MoxR family ATPase [Micromonospora sp. WMMA1949]|uniref:MoxR family ATPase n=1 Tax=unclassified Micromonospora TaxID=2617518 RepID=UPI0022B6E9C5|nr:MoxR family ATPase [Micromonospora sp. WMMA1949]MCZ7429450.1 MoxR family ATPase [Micromonospora sp. WMMA1949]
MSAPGTTDWRIYRGTGEPLDPAERDRRWPAPPRWRTFDGGPDEPPAPAEDPDLERRLGPVRTRRPDPREVDVVNAALLLRRPLLVTGRAGSGRSSLAYRVARELGLGRVLHWPVSTHDTVRAGLWQHDPLGRVRAGQSPGRSVGEELGEHLSLGPLGTALLPYRTPRVLLIDELDQSDIDLPQQLRTVFDDGGFAIPELVRAAPRSPEVTVHTADPGGRATVRGGRVRCHEFPLVVMTCTEDRAFPPAFLRHCLRLRLADPDEATLLGIVDAHFAERPPAAAGLVRAFLDRQRDPEAPTLDQLLDAVQLASIDGGEADWDRLAEVLWRGGPTADPE